MTGATPVSTRPLAVGDRPAWAALWAQYNAFYGRAGETALAPEIVETTWARLHTPGEPVRGLVAERAGEIVGLAHLVFHRNLIRIENTCYLQDLFTRPAARGLGVGRALIDAAAGACREQGVRDIYWHTHSSNAPARALYDRLARNTEFLVYRTPV